VTQHEGVAGTVVGHRGREAPERLARQSLTRTAPRNSRGPLSSIDLGCPGQVRPPDLFSFPLVTGPTKKRNDLAQSAQAALNYLGRDTENRIRRMQSPDSQGIETTCSAGGSASARPWRQPPDLKGIETDGCWGTA
jgi:hypothetical protein